MRERFATVVLIVFFFIGIGSSLPWNVFITAQSYFQHRLSGTTYEDSFLNWFSMAFNVSTLMTMLVRTAVIAERMTSAVHTVFFALVVIMGVMSMHCAWTRMPEFQGYSFFHMTVISILLVACASTLMQEGLLRIVATFPARYTQAVVSGQSFAGLAVSLSNFVILWAGGDRDVASGRDLHASADLSAFTYFALVFLTLVLCLLSFAALTRMHLFRHYQRAECSSPSVKDDNEDAALSEAETIDTFDASPRERLLGEAATSPKVDMLHIAYKIRLYAAATFSIFLVTLSVFPGVTSAIKPVHPKHSLFDAKLFTPFTLILFNSSDFVARLSASWWPELGQKKLLLASIARALFVPLLMLCNLQNKSHQVVTTVIFQSDVLALLFIASCAYTNGLLCTLAFMEYPRLFHKNAEKELGGSIVFFMLSVGLTAGSLMSFVLCALLKP
ncbi:unnamed protein product [Hyaloperonospora brassicae]|uniref:Equilibrative nucleoside transporter 1 n=1 Tax=Hyaloperonospora brassicae TaxID=162125 RepID=A0AAV0U2R5_HYABA|nr:unnamed protein product [Hyaloperonospora brassicae]